MPVDNTWDRRLIRRVRSARRVFVLLLLAAWLPAVLHCDLEAAGLAFATECCEQTDSAGVDHCNPGRCDVAENDFIAASDSAIVPPAAPLCDCLFCALCVPEFAPDDSPSPTALDESAAAPPDVSRRWMFVFRAALSPRAPSLIS